jgi:hypothetical protein
MPRDVPLPKRDIRVFAGDDRPSEASFRFTFPGDITRDALTLAHEVVRDWEQLLKSYYPAPLEIEATFKTWSPSGPGRWRWQQNP